MLSELSYSLSYLYKKSLPSNLQTNIILNVKYNQCFQLVHVHSASFWKWDCMNKDDFVVFSREGVNMNQSNLPFQISKIACLYKITKFLCKER